MPRHSDELFMRIFWVAFVLWSALAIYASAQISSVGVTDAAHYVLSAHSIEQNGFFPGNWYESGFGFSLLILIFSKIGISLDTAARVLSLSFGIANIWLVGDTLARIFNDKRAFVFTLPLFFTYEYAQHALFGFVGTAALFFLFLALNVYWRTKNTLSKWTSALAFGMDLLIRSSHALFLPFFIFSKQNKSYRKGMVGIAIVTLIVYTILKSFNLREDTTLQYVPWISYLLVVPRNVEFYLIALITAFPIIIFAAWGIQTLSRQQKEWTAWWTIPTLLGVLYFPLGNNLYYLFPVIPALLYLGFKGLERRLHFFSNQKRNIILALGVVFLCVAWNGGGWAHIKQDVQQYADIERVIQFANAHFTSQDTIITGLEGLLFFVDRTSQPKNDFTILILPAAIERLANLKDTSAARNDFQNAWKNSFSEGKKVFITSLAYSFVGSPFCQTLNCAPIPKLGKKILDTETVDLYETVEP